MTNREMVMLTASLSGPLSRSSLKGPQVALVAAGLALLAGWALAAMAMPRVLIVPALAFLAFALAGVAALVGRNRSPERGLSYWDVAGMLILAGIFVSQAVEPEAMVQIVRDLNAPQPALAGR
jgi:hypothetical protein